MIVSMKCFCRMINDIKKETFFGIAVGNIGQNNISVSI